MKFPFVILKRSTYDAMVWAINQLRNDFFAAEAERDTILGNASRLADIEREDRKLERSHFEAILSNIRSR